MLPGFSSVFSHPFRSWCFAPQPKRMIPIPRRDYMAREFVEMMASFSRYWLLTDINYDMSFFNSVNRRCSSSTCLLFIDRDIIFLRPPLIFFLLKKTRVWFSVASSSFNYMYDARTWKYVVVVVMRTTSRVKLGYFEQHFNMYSLYCSLLSGSMSLRRYLVPTNRYDGAQQVSSCAVCSVTPSHMHSSPSLPLLLVFFPLIIFTFAPTPNTLVRPSSDPMQDNLVRATAAY